MSGAKNILTVSDVGHSFRRNRVLTGVNLVVPCGQIVGITGENGSGKSTLLKIVAGMLRPDTGTIQVDGKLGYCPQTPLVYDRLTVSENLRLFHAAYGRSGDNIEENSVLERFRLDRFASTIVSDASGGTKQKLNLAIAVMHSPDLLVLDEPYSGFDWETYLRFWDYAREERAVGVAVLIVSHFVYDRAQFDTIYELRGGTLRCISD